MKFKIIESIEQDLEHIENLDKLICRDIYTGEPITDNNKKLNQMIWMLRINNFPIIITPDGKLNVDGGVNIGDEDIDYIPFDFGYVMGHFKCYNNNLESLKGSPDYVGIDFECFDNNLKSLEHGPKYVGGEYDADSNPIQNSVGIPNTGFLFFAGGPKHDKIDDLRIKYTNYFRLRYSRRI